MAALTAQEELLKCIFHVIARASVNPDQARRVIGEGTKQLRAFNLCDGTRTISQVASAAKIDSGNFSRTLARWVSHGLIFKLCANNDRYPLHLYPIPTSGEGLAPRTRKGRKRAASRSKPR